MTGSHDRPLPLNEAARAYFGESSTITGKTLAGEARKGKLRTYRVARRQLTTQADIDHMVKASASSMAPSPPIQNEAAPTSVPVAMAAIRAL